MVRVIIIFCMLLISVILFVSYRSAAGIRKNQRMNITLPYEFLKHPEVTAITEKFKKVNLVFFLISVIGTLPTFFINYTSLSLLYLVIWMGFNFVIGNRLYCRYNSKLLLLKSKNRWFPEPYMYHELDGSCQIKRPKLLKKLYPSPIDRLLAETDEPIYVDEDEHWINGYYFHPGNRRTTVEKRMGAGTTANLATRSGLLSIYGAFVLMTIVFGWIIILFISMDFSNFKMKIGDRKVEIDAPMYDYDFMLSDIMEIRLTDTLPEHGARTNGAATSTYYLGNFRFTSYGSSKMYVYKEYPPYIVIKLTDKTVFFNSKSAKETQEYYKKLLEKKEAID